ncbi:auxin response factor-like protein [Medicago truncatula]|uniref:Auxin response factor n=1 Tax=Medicago truncatula TaxID=3880 RepID=G7K918_MEDTR|nr:auxin response factor-like protein [Medicago truncatula]
MSLPLPPRVDPKIWQICVGPDVKIPKIHSKVYYFPRGHLEHACSSPTAATRTILDRYRSSIPCIVSSVDLFVDPHTDEVFAKLLLTPVTDQEPPPPVVPGQEDDDGDNLVSYVKTLTQSDCTRVLCVPIECSNLIFPKLDLDKSQSITVTDLKNQEWRYTYTYSNSSRLHTGWLNFVREKKLVANDSVVFIKNSAGKISVGIRRNTKFTTDEAAEGSENLTDEIKVLDAAELAEKNTAFDVVYYPTASGWRDFVVDAKTVDDAMKIGWKSGMRVKLPLKKYESSNSKMTISQLKGTISFVFNHSSNVPNWRILEVNWDGLDIPQIPNLVNPWQVEVYNIHAPSTSSSTVNNPRLAESSSPQQIPYSMPGTSGPMSQAPSEVSSLAYLCNIGLQSQLGTR